MIFFFIATATTEIYTYVHTLSLHDALPISYNFHRNGWNSYYTTAAPKIAAQVFPGIPAAQAQTRLNNDLNGINAAGMSSSSGQLVRQAMFINALTESRDSFASGSDQGAIAEIGRASCRDRVFKYV